MSKQPIHSQLAPSAVGPYSQAIMHNDLIYVSGVIAIDPATQQLSGTVAEQTEQIMVSLNQILLAAGSSLQQLIKTTIFLRDVDDFDTVNTVYQNFLTEPYPARICVEVSNIPLGALVEIDAIAYK